MSTQQELIQKIESFEIDSAGAEGAFAERLAKEQKWTPAFTAKVIREYKRFIALAMISTREVTPSKTVDEAWHLHLIFTESYWGRLAQILPKALHHHPGLGAKSDRLKYKEQFRYTLELYRTTFGVAPPSDVWGAVLPDQKGVGDRFRLWATVAAIGLIPLIALVAAGELVIGAIIFGTLALIGAAVAFSPQNPRRTAHFNQSGSTGSCGSTGCGSASCGDTSGAGCGSGGGDGGGGCGGGCGGGGD